MNQGSAAHAGNGAPAPNIFAGHSVLYSYDENPLAQLSGQSLDERLALEISLKVGRRDDMEKAVHLVVTETA